MLIFIVPLKQQEPHRELCTLNTNENQSICKQEAASVFSCSRTTSQKRDDARFILTSEIREIRFAVTAQWPEPWQCKSPKSREHREEPGLGGRNLQRFTGTTGITWISPTLSRRYWHLHTLDAIFATVFVVFWVWFLYFFLFRFGFWCKLEHFLCFPFCRAPHYVFMRLPCLLLLHLFCIRRDLVSTQLSGREGKA